MDALRNQKLKSVQIRILLSSLFVFSAGRGALADHPGVIEPVQVELPFAIDDDGDENQSSDLIAPVAAITSRELDLSLDQPVSTENTGPSFQLIRKEALSDKQVWNVILQNPSSADDSARWQESVRVGRFYTDNAHLKFQWESADLANRGDQLRNYVLCICQGERPQRVALRTCKFVEPIELDLDLTSQKVPLPQYAVPPSESLFLQVLFIEDFRISTELQPADGLVSANKFARIQLKDWAFPAEVRTKIGKSRGLPVAIVMANYKFDKRWRPMTIKHVDHTMSDLRKSLGKNQRDNRRYRAGLVELPARISRLQSLIRNSNNAFDTGEWSRQLTKAKRYYAKARGGARRTSNMIPELESRIRHLKNLQHLGNKIHKKAKIHFRIGIETQNGEVDLLRTTSELERLAAND